MIRSASQRYRLTIAAICLIVGWVGWHRNSLFAWHGNGTIAIGDPLTVSGLAFIAIGLVGSIRLEKLFWAALYQLNDDGILSGTRSAVDVIGARIENSLPRWQLIGALATASSTSLAVLFFYRGTFGITDEGQRLKFAYGVEFLVFATALALIVGSRFGVAARLGLIARDFSRAAVKLRMVPSHPDKHGGTATITTIFGYAIGLGGLAVLWLVFWIVYLSGDNGIAKFFGEMRHAFYGFLFVLVGVMWLALLVPTRGISKLYSEAKIDLLASLRRPRSLLPRASAFDRLEGHEETVKYFKIRDSIRDLPSTPLVGLPSRLLLLTKLSPILPIAIEHFSNGEGGPGNLVKSMLNVASSIFK